MGADREWLVEHRFRALQEVLSDGQPVTEVARRYAMSRQTLYVWKRRYEDEGVLGLRELSRRPRHSPTRLAAQIEARICEMRREHRRWGARRICFELASLGVDPAPSRATVHRVLVRNGLVEPQQQRHKRRYKRWQRDVPMQLWQLDIVEGPHLANGRRCKIVTGVDDHSRFAVIAKVVMRQTGRAVCEAFTEAMARYGVPDEVLTDNGKQFTGRFTKPRPAEVRFERICRTTGITQRLTKRRSPTTTGKIERFHRSLQEEFLDETSPFADVPAAQAALDGWVRSYNELRPHQSLDMATPASRFQAKPTEPAERLARADRGTSPAVGQSGQGATSVEPPVLSAGTNEPVAVELSLVVPGSGALSLAGHQQVWVGRAFATRTVTVWADQRSIHLSYQGERLKTIPSRLSGDDLLELTLRGARPAGPAPGAPALRPGRALPADQAIMLERTATRHGTIQIGGKPITIGAPVAGQRLTLRLDGHLMHVIANGHLIKTLPAPIPADERPGLIGAQPAHTPLPPPPPAGPALARRRVPNDGVIMIARQRLRIGRAHAGKTVTILIEDTHYRVLHDGEELTTHPRQPNRPVTHLKPRRRVTNAQSKSTMS